jgi:predicted TIM-barrel fold metal-dependent hydrolase
MSPDNADEHRRQCVALIKKHNIVLAVVDGSSPKALDSWEVALGEGIIPGFRLDNPGTEVQLDSFLAWVNRGEIELFGEIGATYAGLSPSDSIFDPYWEICQRFDIPVGIHTGGSFPGIHLQIPTFRLRLGDPFLVEDIVVKYPDLRLYLMHAGGHFYERAAILMVQYPTLYVDIAVLNWVPDANNFLVPFLRKAKEYDVLDRVMYGSDEMVWPAAIEMAIEEIQSLDILTLEEKEGIFYSNAARFLGLSQEAISRHHEGQQE